MLKKTLFSIFILFLFFQFPLQAQQNAILKYIPDTRGHILKLPVTWQFINCYGQVHITITTDEKAAISQGYIYEGERYSPSGLGSELFDKPEFTAPHIAGDLYFGNTNLGEITLKYIGDAHTGCYGQTYHVTKMLGLDDKGYNDKINSFTFKNLKIISMNSSDSKVEIYISKLLQAEEKKELVSENQSESSVEDERLVGRSTGISDHNQSRKRENEKREITLPEDNYNPPTEHYNERLRKSEQAHQQSLQNFSNTMNYISSMYQQAEIDAQEIKKAEEQRRKEEEAREEASTRKILEDKIRARDAIGEFIDHFRSHYIREIDNLNDIPCVYYYFGSYSSDFDKMSGELYLSAIFPVYKMGNNRWPYIIELENKIKEKSGKAIIRGYFTTLQEAENDKSRIISEARSAYFTKIAPKAYAFNFNEPASQLKPVDFWGAGSTQKASTGETNFWGVKKTERTDSSKVNSNKPSPDKKEQVKTDFWGNEIK